MSWNLSKKVKKGNKTGMGYELEVDMIRKAH